MCAACTPCGGGYGRLNQRDYLPVWLQDAGYVTSHIGKFLNGYGKEVGTPMRPRGWSDWQGLIDHSTYRMWGYSFFENDHRVTYGKVMSRNPRLYQTDVVTTKAVSSSTTWRRRGPFFLSVAYLAPHHESGTTQGDRAAGARRPRASRPLRASPAPEATDYNETTLGQAVLHRHAPTARSAPPRGGDPDPRLRERWDSLLAVDDGVERIVEELRRMGELDNTYVIFTSDNGFMQGEHRVRQGKMLPYDASTHLPLLIRGPGVPRDRRTKAVVGDVDLAPTMSRHHLGPGQGTRSTAGPSCRTRATRTCATSGRSCTRQRDRAPTAAPTRARAGRREPQTRVPAWARGAHDALAVRGLQGTRHPSCTTSSATRGS